ncbi:MULTISPECIES: serine/threonine-protein kinase [Actinomadura]|uniref:non-specific serine/threonine protein kinase n=1 Tax=Actinomadura yumaensis TaxID=111807 RepID=A0ABW2CCG3_9ACTN|nr:serine/threonine-protein kinase [Actinomadura sp. J1-007]MWK38254.1 protein kinase [Actinomadura sp. J1-007]
MADLLVHGRYRLLELLGTGGMGSVWRARDELLGRQVAVKRIDLPEDVSPAERDMLCERASREARAAAMLDHPNVVAVHDVVVADGLPWIVMELLEGGSLAEAVAADGPMPPDRVAALGLALLGALAVAHREGLVHRDVKPANVLISADGRAVLTDFGVAALDGDPALTRTGTLIGSPGFIAPERLRDAPAGPASDLWSLGATLYAAAEGREPFGRGTAMATLSAVLTEDEPYPVRSGPLAPVLVRLMAKDPSARLGPAAARDALRRVAEGGDSGLPDQIRRRRRPALVVSAGLVPLAAVAVLLWPGHGGERPAARPRVLTSAPDPCALITDREAGSLIARAVRRPNWPVKGHCAWWTSKVPASLAVSAPQVFASAAEARGKLTKILNEKAADQPSTGAFKWDFSYLGLPAEAKGALEVPRTLPGVGEQAIAYTYRGSDPALDSENVVVRQGNVFVHVEFRGARGTAADGARRAAVLVAGALARLERRG